MKPRHPILIKELARKYWPFAILAGILLSLLVLALPYLEQWRAANWVASKGGSVSYRVPGWLGKSVPSNAQDWLVSKRGNDWSKPIVSTTLVDLGKSDITDDDLRRLEDFIGLKMVRLNETKISGRGLVHVTHQPGLWFLELRDCAVTDAGVAPLQICRGMRFLNLNGNSSITDAGLEHLENLSNLINLGVAETNVSEEGVDRLQNALPRCNIQTDR